MAEAKMADAQPQAEAEEFSDFGALLNKEFKPKTDHAQDAIQTAVQTLAEQALESTVVVSNDVVNTDRGDDRRDRPQAHRADQPDHAPSRVPAARERLARPLTISSTTPRPTRC